VHLGELIDFVGNLLDYDPTNVTYRAQLVSILNDSQTRTLTDRPWDFSMKERVLRVYTDASHLFNVVNGSATVAGTAFPIAGSVVKPGSRWDRGIVTITDSAGVTQDYTIAFVRTANQLFLDRDFEGVTGAYTVTIKFRDVYLPSDTMTIQNVGDPIVGIPAKAAFLSKWEREDANLDPDLLGVIEAYLPSTGRTVPAPQTARGVSVVSGSSQGVRTIQVYMVNVHGPRAINCPVYRRDVSDGFESALSKVGTFVLADNQTLTMTPETINAQTGLYRRYYFTCAEAGILAPVRARNADNEQGGGLALDVDTVDPFGSVTLKPDLSLATLTSQNFHSRSIRYVWNNSAAYQSVQLFPHPSSNQDLNVRAVITPARMQEDQDAPMVPASYAQVIAYAALEALTLKVDNPALSAVYQRKKEVLYKGMEQRFLQAVPRRIIKGTPTAGYRFTRNPFGPLTFS
tara:strand:- start:6439 stop:7812 length:1374 start_codon:yes stop_codon:yes gene_type:complete